MQGWQRERIVGTYSRQTADCNGKHIVHDGDCGIYNAFLGVCTCGLHHCLMASSSEVVEELYPKYIEEKCNDGFIEYLLQEFETGNLYVKDKEEFVKVERPEPISQEEFDKAMDKIQEEFQKRKNNDKQNDK